MPGIFDQDSTQFVDDGTGQTSKIACYADISIDPAPSYQKFFDEPCVPRSNHPFYEDSFIC